MKKHFSRREIALLITFVVILVATTAFLTLEVYRYSKGDSTAFLNVPRAEPRNIFFDLRIWTINGADCNIPLGEITAEKHCAQDLYKFNYPVYFLYLIRFLGVSSSWHAAYGVGLAVCAMACMILLMGRLYRECQDKGGRLLILIFSIAINMSFPWRYAIERGQTDLIVFCLLAIPFILSSAKKDNDPRGSPLTSMGLIIALIGSAFIKLFTLPSALFCVIARVLTTLNKRGLSRSGQLTIYGWGIFMLFTTLALIPSFRATSTLNIVNLGGHGFGFETLMKAGYVNSYANGAICKITFAAIGLCIFCNKSLVGSLFVRPDSLLRRISHNVERLSVSDSYVCLAAIMYSSIYVVTESINYKWIFILPVPACLVAISSLKRVRTGASQGSFRLLGTAIFISMGLLSVPFNPTTYSYIEWIGHFALHPLCIGGLLSCSISILVANEV